VKEKTSDADVQMDREREGGSERAGKKEMKKLTERRPRERMKRLGGREGERER
jgi:hypothetical protein